MKNFKEKLAELISNVEELSNRAYRDSLTHLQNRAALDDILLTYLNRLGGSDQFTFALLYMDLNGFKSVNDTLGHTPGDQVLIEIAKRLDDLHGDLAFRLGGDEFVVIIPDCPTSDRAFEQAEHIRIELSRPCLNEQKVIVAPSIGIVVCDERANYDDDDMKALSEVIGNGDATMYKAKLLSKTSLIMSGTDRKYVPQGRCLVFGSWTPVEFKFPDFRSTLRSGFGMGRLIIGDNTHECDFRFVQYSDGEVRLMCRLHLPELETTNAWRELLFRDGAIKAQFEGVVEDTQDALRSVITSHDNEVVAFASDISLGTEDDHVDISFYFSEAGIDFRKDLVSSIRFHLTNLRFPEDPFDPEKSLNFKLSESHVRLGMVGKRMHHLATVEELEATGDIKVTCWAEVEIKSANQIKKVVEDFGVICTLLTFLQGSRVNWISYDLLSSSGEVVQSHCRNSITGKLVSENTSGLWTVSYLQNAIPKMFQNLPLAQEKWNLQTVLAFMSQAQDDAYFEVRGYKTIYCIELLVNAYLCQDNLQAQELDNSSEADKAFEPSLAGMCRALKLNCLTNPDESQEDALERIVNDVARLRASLQQKGTLWLPQQGPKDDELRQRFNFERYRRWHFLQEFTTDCLEAILYPEGNYSLCGLYMHEFQNKDDSASNPTS